MDAVLADPDISGVGVAGAELWLAVWSWVGTVAAVTGVPDEVVDTTS